MKDLPEEVEKAVSNPRRAFGPYVLLRLLGKGGMGEVHLGWERSLRRYVAIKILKDVDEEGLKRFEREAQLAARLEHPNIATVYGTGAENGKHYIAMQYVEGETAEKVSEEDADPRRAARIAKQVASALGYAHDRRVVHRDVTPRNIIVDLDGAAVLTDFGIAKHSMGGGTLTESGILIGTPGYMSPEQTTARMVDPRSDLYQLGATMYYMVTQSAPFSGDDMMSVLDRIRREDPEVPTRLNPSIPSMLERIVLKAMEKNPAARYQTGREMEEDLERFLAGQAVRARPAGAFRKWVRRRSTKIGVAVVSAVLVALAIGWWAAPSPPPDQSALREAVTQYYMFGPEAEKAIPALIRVSPDSPEKHYLVALYHLRKGDSDAAERNLERARAYAPSRLIAGLLAFRKYILGQTQRFVILSTFMALPTPPILPPEPPELRESLIRGREEIQAYVERVPGGDAADRFASGVLAFSREEYRTAILDLDQAKSVPFLARDARILMGIAHCLREEYGRSREVLRHRQVAMGDDYEYEVRRLLAFFTFARVEQEKSREVREALLDHLGRLREIDPDRDPSEGLQHPLLRMRFKSWIDRAASGGSGGR